MFFLTKKSYFITTTKKSAKKEEIKRQRNERKNEFTFNFKNGRIVKEFTSKLGRETRNLFLGSSLRFLRCRRRRLSFRPNLSFFSLEKGWVKERTHSLLSLSLSFSHLWDVENFLLFGWLFLFCMYVRMPVCVCFQNCRNGISFSISFCGCPQPTEILWFSPESPSSMFLKAHFCDCNFFFLPSELHVSPS